MVLRSAFSLSLTADCNELTLFNCRKELWVHKSVQAAKEIKRSRHGNLLAVTRHTYETACSLFTSGNKQFLLESGIFAGGADLRFRNQKLVNDTNLNTATIKLTRDLQRSFGEQVLFLWMSESCYFMDPKAKQMCKENQPAETVWDSFKDELASSLVGQAQDVCQARLESNVRHAPFESNSDEAQVELENTVQVLYIKGLGKDVFEEQVLPDGTKSTRAKEVLKALQVTGEGISEHKLTLEDAVANSFGESWRVDGEYQMIVQLVKR